jgi:hypothetical protein
VDVADTSKRYTAGRATYPGDNRHAVGQLVGPTMLRQFLVIAAAIYMPERDATALVFSTLIEGDPSAVIVDEHGQAWIEPEQLARG